MGELLASVYCAASTGLGCALLPSAASTPRPRASNIATCNERVATLSKCRDTTLASSRKQQSLDSRCACLTAPWIDRFMSNRGQDQREVKVANHSDTQSSAPFGISVSELLVDWTGAERIDRTWVGLAYGADVTPIEKDNRRETRPTAASEPHRLAAGFRLGPGEQRSWKIRLLAQQLSVENARRSGSSRSLVLVPQTPAPKQAQKPRQALKPEEPIASVQTATAKVPILVLPAQRLRNELLGDWRGPPFAASLLSGEDAELQQIAYAQPDVHSLVIESQELSQASNGDAGRPDALPNADSLSRSDVTGLSEDEQAQPSAPTRPLDAWPAVPGGVNGDLDGTARIWEAGGSADRQSPYPPQTPMTASDVSAPKAFNLRLAENLLVRLALCPPPDGAVSLGTTLSGTLDFRSSQEAAAADGTIPKCVQVAVLLETEEQIHERWTVGLPVQVAPTGIRKVQDEHQELTPNTLLTHFMLSLPGDAPASFSTHLLALRWVLRFEFTTTAQQAAGGWFGGGGRTTDTLSWSLPILVKPGS